MSRKGNCWENAVSESFFATLEKELLAIEPLRTRSTMRQLVADYIDKGSSELVSQGIYRSRGLIAV